MDFYESKLLTFPYHLNRLCVPNRQVLHRKQIPLSSNQRNSINTIKKSMDGILFELAISCFCISFLLPFVESIEMIVIDFFLSHFFLSYVSSSWCLQTVPISVLGCWKTQSNI